MTGQGLVPISLPRGHQVSHLPTTYIRHESLILGVAGFMAFILLWEVGSGAGLINRFFFSAPSLIVEAGAREIQLPRFWVDIRTSAMELAVGSLAAVVLGVPIGLAIGWYRRLGYMVDPLVNFFNALPRIALLPLLVLWLGLGTELKYAVVFLGVLFSIVVPTAQGVKTVDRVLLDVGRSLRASQRRIFATIVLPSTVPFILAGLRMGIGRGLMGVVVAEFYAQTSGVGVIIVKSAQQLDSSRMLFAVSLFTLAGIALAVAVNGLERRVGRWRPSQATEDQGT